jgi:hypothetical protein
MRGVNNAGAFQNGDIGNLDLLRLERRDQSSIENRRGQNRHGFSYNGIIRNNTGVNEKKYETK